MNLKGTSILMGFAVIQIQNAKESTLTVIQIIASIKVC